VLALYRPSFIAPHPPEGRQSDADRAAARSARPSCHRAGMAQWYPAHRVWHGGRV